MMLVPMDSINISATPSLSFILKHRTERQTRLLSRLLLRKKKKKGEQVLHSTVQRTESVALDLLEHFLIQQHLHTRVVSWKEGGVWLKHAHTHTHTSSALAGQPGGCQHRCSRPSAAACSPGCPSGVCVSWSRPAAGPRARPRGHRPTPGGGASGPGRLAHTRWPPAEAEPPHSPPDLSPPV